MYSCRIGQEITVQLTTNTSLSLPSLTDTECRYDHPGGSKYDHPGGSSYDCPEDFRYDKPAVPLYRSRCAHGKTMCMELL